MHLSVSCVLVAVFCLMAGGLPGAEAGFCATNIVTSKVDICGGLDSPRVFVPDPRPICPRGCTALNLDAKKLTFHVNTVTSLKPCCGNKKPQLPTLPLGTLTQPLPLGRLTKPLSILPTARLPKIDAELTLNVTAEYSALSVNEKNQATIDFSKATGRNILSARPPGPLCFTDASFKWQTFCKNCYHYKGQCCSKSCGRDACHQVHEGTAIGVARVFNFHDFEWC